LGRVDVEPHLPDGPGRIDEKGVPGGEFGDGQIDDRAILRRNRRLSVGEQLEVQTFLGAELLVRLFILRADAEDHGVFCFELGEVALEAVGFDGAAGREVLGIEIEDHPFAAIVTECNGFAFL